MGLSFDSMANPLSKTNARRNKRFNFVIFVVWSVLIVSKWLVVARSGNSCFRLAEISTLVFLVLSGFVQGRKAG